MCTAPVGNNVPAPDPRAVGFAGQLRVLSTQVVLGTSLIGVLTVLIYYPVLVKLAIDWWRIPDNSHGLLVAPFAAYLLWARGEAIWKTRITPTWSGVGLVALALTVLLLGEFGANLFLSRISIVILLTGFAIGFGGWAVLRQVRFPLLVLLLAIPLPRLLLNQITFPLQVWASSGASNVLSLLGVPVLREGNVIQLPEMKLEVAEACSGIRSLVSLVAMAVFYGYYREKSTFRRSLLVLSSVPIAITANSLRIVGTGLCVQYWDPEAAKGFFHEFSGWVMFLVSLVCLFLVQRFISMFGKAGHRAWRH